MGANGGQRVMPLSVGPSVQRTKNSNNS